MANYQVIHTRSFKIKGFWQRSVFNIAVILNLLFSIIILIKLFLFNMANIKNSGLQFNPKGVTQGNTLVDYRTGNPISVKTDSFGNQRLCVDASLTIDTVEVDVRSLVATRDSIAIKDTISLNSLKVETDGSINTNCAIHAADGDNIAIVDPVSSNILKINPDGSIVVSINFSGTSIDPRQIRLLTSSDSVTANQGGSWNITNISGTVSLPTGAATETTVTSIALDTENLDVLLSSRATQVSVNNIPTDPLLSTDSRLSNLDTTVSSRATQLSVNGLPTAADNATAVWSTTIPSTPVTNSFGEYISKKLLTISKFLGLK